MATAIAPRQGASTTRTARSSIVPVTSTGFRLSAALILVATAAGAGTFFVPSVLSGPAVMNGSARGTALIVMLVAVPAAIVGMVLAARGSARGLLVWLGAVAYFIYNGFMFLIATPFNNLFLVYVAMFSLSIWTMIAVLTRIDRADLGRRFSDKLPARAIAIFVWVVTGLNVLVWLKTVIPAVLSNNPTSVLAGTGVSTVPTYVQDLSFWLPLAAVAAAWLWRRSFWGYLGIGILLVYWAIEGVGVATDQWFGSSADPASTVASAVMVPVFAVLALATLVPIFFHLRNVDRTDQA